MRNNNITIVKCFISSFAGKHIHQSSRGGWVDVWLEAGSWGDAGTCYEGAGLVVVAPLHLQVDGSR